MKMYRILIALTTIVFSGCTKDVIDIAPEQYISDSKSITDAKSAEAAVYGAYSTLESDSYLGGSGYIALTYLLGDNVKWTGSLNYYREFNVHSYNSDNTTITVSWNAIYRTINAANNIIAAVPSLQDVNLTEANKNKFLGEAYFIRAWAYFDLVKNWGGVPLVTNPTRTPDDGKGIKRSTAEQTWQQIKSDLDKAEQLLPAAINKNRATKSAVYALKARYHLYRSEWAEAESNATKTLSSADFTPLVSPYSTFFKNKNSKESILELAYSTSKTNSHSSQWLPSTEGGSRQWAPTDAIVNLLRDPAIGGNRKDLVKNLSATDNANYVGILYYRQTKDDPAYLLRVAEQYLIRAEARANLGTNLSGALADLNEVRKRAEVPLSNASDKESLLLAIELERRVEFAFESHRWYDLIRTKKAQQVLNVPDVNRLLLPIPYSDILADKDIEQNPGYGK